MLFEKAYGVGRLGDRQPLGSNTPFEIGSVTKQFTAAAILQLVDLGKLHLNTKLGDIVPEYTAGRTVTIRQLLNQTSGIPNYTTGADLMQVASTQKPTLGAVLSRISKTQLDFASGSHWAYSNTNYFLLATIIARTSGVSYEDYLRRNIFAKAGLRQTCFIDDERSLTNMPQGYLPGNPPHPSPRVYGGWGAGAGDIVSTASDLLKWDDALLSGIVVPVADVTLMRRSGTLTNGKNTTYGMGWFINKRRGIPEVWHNGGTFGFSADNETFPTRQLTIVVLDNDIGADAEDVGQTLFDRLDKR